MTVDRVTGLLAAADTSWRTARGVCRHWRDQTLVTKAFEAYSERRGTSMSVSRYISSGEGGPEHQTYRAESDGDADEHLETVVALAVDRVRSRRRAELVSWVGEEVRTDLLVIDGDTFWGRTGLDVLTNGGDPNSSHGGAEMSELLQPSVVLDLFEIAVVGAEDVVAGRACLTVEAHRIEVPPGHTTARDPFAMITGGNDFRLSVDVATGVLLRVVKIVDGKSAEICEFLSLDLDVELPDVLFAPLEAGAGRLIDTRTLQGPRQRSVPRRRLRDVARRMSPFAWSAALLAVVALAAGLTVWRLDPVETDDALVFPGDASFGIALPDEGSTSTVSLGGLSLCVQSPTTARLLGVAPVGADNIEILAFGVRVSPIARGGVLLGTSKAGLDELGFASGVEAVVSTVCPDGVTRSDVPDATGPAGAASYMELAVQVRRTGAGVGHYSALEVRYSTGQGATTLRILFDLTLCDARNADACGMGGR